MDPALQQKIVAVAGTWLGLQATTFRELAARVRAGISWRAYRRLARDLRAADDAWRYGLPTLVWGTPSAPPAPDDETESLPSAQSDRLARVARVLAEVAYADPGAPASAWLARPHAALNWAVPLSLLDTDAGCEAVVALANAEGEDAWLQRLRDAGCAVAPAGAKATGGAASASGGTPAGVQGELADGAGGRPDVLAEVATLLGFPDRRADALALADAVRAGLPWEVYVRVGAALMAKDEVWDERLPHLVFGPDGPPAPPDDETTPLSPEASDRLVRVVTVVSTLTVETPELRPLEWLATPHPALRDLPPAAWLDTGPGCRAVVAAARADAAPYRVPDVRDRISRLLTDLDALNADLEHQRLETSSPYWDTGLWAIRATDALGRALMALPAPGSKSLPEPVALRTPWADGQHELPRRPFGAFRHLRTPGAPMDLEALLSEEELAAWEGGDEDNRAIAEGLRAWGGRGALDAATVAGDGPLDRRGDACARAALVRRAWQRRRPRAGRPFALVAVDLEGTVVSTAVHQAPRPGLGAFCAGVAALTDRVVWYSSVPEARGRALLALLASEGHLPPDALAWGYVHARGGTKPLSGLAPGVPLDRLALLDDQPGVVAPGEAACLVPVAAWEPPYATDDALAAALGALQARAAQARVLAGIDAALGTIPDYPDVET